MTDDPAKTARDLADEAKGAAASLASDLQETAKAASKAASAQASQFASDVGHELNEVAEEQKVRGAEAIQGFARAINSAAQELEGQSPGVARFIRDTAAQVDTLSNNLRGRSATELMGAATDLARSQPAVFFAGAMAAGFALSRFLKSSAPANRSGPGSTQRSASGAQTRGASVSTQGTATRPISPATRG
jgi:hypothetical protein